jgi:hypothetical protein
VTAEHVRSEVLSRLEQAELRSLSWGRVDVSLTEEEVLDLIEQVTQDRAGAHEVLDDLLDLRLVRDLNTAEATYRTRFAETVRMVARVRQWFPGKPWRRAPQLVNDLRVHAGSRSYPRRHIDADEVIRRVNAVDALSSAEEQAVQSMLATRGGGTLDLADFQVEAFEHLRAMRREGGLSAVIVTAGTGSGKTKAFYLPALADVAGHPGAGTAVLAIYPRNELLKDQIVEALDQADRITQDGGRTTRLGAYFGPTAYSPTQASLKDSSGWRAVNDGFDCLYLRCPRGCGRDLRWETSDLKARREVVCCPGCGWRSREGQVALTRDSIHQDPPDVLFTSTEMLNRCLGSSDRRSVMLGVSGRRPRYLLLDEVHTYVGAHGAQVALLLRRWRALLGRGADLQVIGLSATLESPEEFMVSLAGIDNPRHVTPRRDDMVSEGAEYTLVLRGNPMSGTALLSTTIQATFALARMLESRSAPEPTGTSGSRLFAFTDTLDVHNRLLWDLRDAERRPLAALRDPAQQPVPEADDLDRDGQTWWVPPQIGRDLTPAGRLKITGTSSQRPGVDPDADVVVATSSLEVGFDDPEAGAVVQHKAPRDESAFLQRRGRAGRQRSHRPWTMVILSDFGRDRLAYQAFETLLSPTLRARRLPVDNLHVLKMQAAFCLLDWLAAKIPGFDARRDLHPARAGAHRAVLRRLQQVLEEHAGERELERFVRRSLDLDDRQTQAVMWDPPRALMTDVVPTLHRRLVTDWRTATGHEDLVVRGVPLPEFAPPSLFTDLNLPEVEITAHNLDGDPYTARLGVTQALHEFLPGTASRRYGIRRDHHWHWVPPAEDGESLVDAATWVTKSGLAATILLPGEEQGRPVLRPVSIELQPVPREKQSSRTTARWHSEHRPSAAGWDVSLPKTAELSALPSMRFHTHTLGNEIEVVRAVTAVADDAPGAVDVQIAHEAGGQLQPAAVGFVSNVDAICLPLQMDALPSFGALQPSAQRAVRTTWFSQIVALDEVLAKQASTFDREWLAALSLAVLGGVAGREGGRLRQTLDRVRILGWTVCLKHGLEAVFAVSSEYDETRAVERLKDLVQDPRVTARLDAAVERLAAASDDDPDLAAHLQAVGLATYGAAVREALQRLLPTQAVEDLVLDLPTGLSDPPAQIWLVEPTVGGGDAVDAARRQVAEDPHRFARLLAASSGPTEHEVVDRDVRRLVEKAVQAGGEVAAAFAAVRTAVGVQEATDAQRRLLGALHATGVPPARPTLTTLNLRVLRPGSSPATDELLVNTLAQWDRVEDLLGLEVDARTVAYVGAGGDTTLGEVYSLLWPRGQQARAAVLSAWSRYARLPPIERLVLNAAGRQRLHVEDLGGGDLTALKQALVVSGRAALRAPVRASTGLQRALLRLLVEPIDTGTLIAHPRVVAIDRDDEYLFAELEVAEVVG